MGISPGAAGAGLVSGVSSGAFSSLGLSAIAVFLSDALLLDQLIHRLQQLIAGRNHLRGGIETVLRDDHVAEFRGEIDVGGFQHAGLDRADTAGGCGLIKLIGSRRCRVTVQAVTRIRETILIIVVLQSDITGDIRGAVLPRDRDGARGIDGEVDYG